MATEAPTKAVRDPESFRGALDAWMRRVHPDRAGLRVHDVDMPRSTGFSNETVFFRATWREGAGERTERFVARIEPRDGGLFPEQTPACAVSVGVQHRIMSAIAASGVVPMPPMGAYEPDASVLGSPFFAMGFVEGRVPADWPRYSVEGFLVDEATPAERERMVTSGLDAMAALHRLDPATLDLGWLDPSGRGRPTFAMQLDLYRDYCARELAGRPHPVMTRALDWLETYEPKGAPMGLSWGDARLGNMIWQDYRCAAVCDWEACALSPPDADIGWWVMFDRMSFDDLGAPRLAGFPTREQMVARWEEGVGRKVAGDILYWEIFGAMRFCAIMIKLSDRFLRAGMQTPETSTAVDNPVTQALSRLLDAAD
ncbi:MAG: phosphotransferase family protein [Myxococcota bacterium]|nr:phosphotransferase family protein [Myxococcales bacterium]